MINPVDIVKNIALWQHCVHEKLPCHIKDVMLLFIFIVCKKNVCNNMKRLGDMLCQ